MNNKRGMRDENEDNEEELDEAALRASARPKSGNFTEWSFWMLSKPLYEK